jgi:hypothetical protein
MTGEHAENPITEGARSLEVRWIFPGRADAAVAGWFGRFPAGVEPREDAYLAHPQLPGLSVKIRGHGALEVKVYGGSPGILEVAGRARGRMESWQKWSFPCGPPSHGGAPPTGWVPVHKRISRFSLAAGQVRARVPGPGAEPGCMVKLTEVHRHRQGLVDPGVRGHRPGQPAPTRTGGHRHTRARRSPARWHGTRHRSLPVVCRMARPAARHRNRPLILNPHHAVIDEQPEPGDTGWSQMRWRHNLADPPAGATQNPRSVRALNAAVTPGQPRRSAGLRAFSLICRIAQCDVFYRGGPMPHHRARRGGYDGAAGFSLRWPASAVRRRQALTGLPGPGG